MNRSTLFALLFALPFLLTALAHADNLFIVTQISDGDSITCQGCGITFKLRLAGIDAPEEDFRGRSGQPYAEQARKFLQGLVLKKQVTIEQVGLDGFNRVLGIVYVSSQNINLEMVGQGYAEVYRGKHSFDIRPFWNAEEEALTARK